MTQETGTAPAEQQEAWRRYLPRLLFAQLLISFAFGFAGPFLPLYIQEISGFDARQAALWSGIIASVNGPVSFFSGPLWGVLSDWFGHKRNVLRGSVGAVAVMFMTAVARDLPFLVFTRAVMGFVTGVNPAMMGLAASLVPKKHVAPAVGQTQAMNALGNTLGPLMGGFFVAWLGLRAGWWASGVLFVAAGLVVLFGVRESFHGNKSTSKTFGSFFNEMKVLLKSPGMMGALGVLCLVQLAPNIYFPVVPFFLKSLDANVGTPAIGLYFTVMGITTTLAAWGAGAALQRFGFKTVLIASSMLGVLGVLAMAAVQAVPHAIACGAIIGLALGALTAGASALVGMAARHDRQGSAFGAVQAASSLGFGFGPLIGGVTANLLGLRAPFLIGAAVFLVIAAVIARFKAASQGERTVQAKIS